MNKWHFVRVYTADCDADGNVCGQFFTAHETSAMSEDWLRDIYNAVAMNLDYDFALKDTINQNGELVLSSRSSSTEQAKRWGYFTRVQLSREL